MNVLVFKIIFNLKSLAFILNPTVILALLE
jgi:hypothetical protein